VTISHLNEKARLDHPRYPGYICIMFVMNSLGTEGGLDTLQVVTEWMNGRDDEYSCLLKAIKANLINDCKLSRR